MITREKVKFFNVQNDIKERKPTDTIEFARLKVLTFIQGNPVNQSFIRREKARLPYSVFKPHSN